MGPITAKSVRGCCHTLRATFFPALFEHFWDTTRVAWAIGVLQKGRPRAELGLGKAPKWGPPLGVGAALVEHFEQVLKQRLRRPLPRGFILV